MPQSDMVFNRSCSGVYGAVTKTRAPVISASCSKRAGLDFGCSQDNRATAALQKRKLL